LSPWEGWGDKGKLHTDGFLEFSVAYNPSRPPLVTGEEGSS